MNEVVAESDGRGAGLLRCIFDFAFCICKLVDWKVVAVDNEAIVCTDFGSRVSNKPIPLETC